MKSGDPQKGSFNILPFNNICVLLFYFWTIQMKFVCLFIVYRLLDVYRIDLYLCFSPWQQTQPEIQ